MELSGVSSVGNDLATSCANEMKLAGTGFFFFRFTIGFFFCSAAATSDHHSLMVVVYKQYIVRSCKFFFFSIFFCRRASRFEVKLSASSSTLDAFTISFGGLAAKYFGIELFFFALPWAS